MRTASARLSRRIIIGAFLCSAAARSWAGGAGTSSANFLKIPVGTKQVAMGDQGVALPLDASTLNHNPANISFLKYQEISLEHNQWAAGVTQEYGSYVYPKSWGAFGASLNMFQVGSFQGYDNTGGDAGSISAQDSAATFGFGTNVWGRSDPLDGPGLSAGVSMTALRERLESDSASTFAGDAGLLYHFDYKDIPLNAGFALRNMGPGLSYYGGRAPLPRTYAAGLSAATHLRGSLTTFSVELRKVADAGVGYSLGAEYWVNSLLALRTGYVNSDDLGPGIRAGVGLKIKIVEFDYAMSILGSFGLTHRAGLTVRFGAPIEKTPGELSPQTKEANKAVRKAQHLIAEKRYLDALLEINRALQIDSSNPEALAQLERVQALLKEMDQPKAP